MNVFSGMTVKHPISEREYKVIEIARNWTDHTLYVVFKRANAGTTETHCASLAVFTNLFDPVDKPFFLRER